jgi:hypothetical protein
VQQVVPDQPEEQALLVERALQVEQDQQVALEIPEALVQLVVPDQLAALVQ